MAGSARLDRVAITFMGDTKTGIVGKLSGLMTWLTGKTNPGRRVGESTREFQDSEQYLRDAADSVPGLVAVVDTDLCYRFANREYANWFGLDPEKIVGRPVTEVAGKEIFEKKSKFLDAALAGQEVSYEGELVKRDGELINYLASLMPQRRVEEKVTGFVTFVQDITERKQAEIALGRSEQRLRAILENTAEGIITAGEDGLIEIFNPMAEILFGYRAEEVIGKNLNLLMPGQYAPRHDDAIRNYLETGKGKILGVQARELEGQKKDGTSFPIEINLSEFFLGGERRFIGTIRDISDRKKVEEEARHNARNQQLLQAVMQAANEARTVEVALEDCLEVVSAHAGWSVGHAYVVEDENPDLLVPTRLWYWYFDDPGKFETFRRVMQETTIAKGEDLPGKVFESGKPAWVVDASHDADFSKARKTRDFNVASAMAVPVPVRGGVGAVMEFFSDEIKPLDPSLLQIMAQVGAQVGQVIERNQAIEQLAETMEEIEFANHAKSEFLANMSHELRTPLNSIIGFSEVVRDGIFGPVGNPRYQEYLEDIHSSGKHLLDLINDILDISKVEAGAMTPVEEWVNIEEIIASSMRLIEGSAEKGDVTLSTVIPADLPWLLADELRVKQILLNLLSNAVKFTPAGGKITVQAAPNDDGTLTISVEDTGIGIPEDEIEEVLKPFTQARSGLAQRQEGTGLGLYLVKMLIEMHDGAMEIKSSLGAGTRISVSFPKERIAKASGKPMAKTG